MSVLLALAAGDRAARTAGTAALDDRGAEITLVLPRPEIGTLGRIRRRSVAPVTPILPLPDSLSARRLLSRGQAVTMVACVAISWAKKRYAAAVGTRPADVCGW